MNECYANTPADTATTVDYKKSLEK